MALYGACAEDESQIRGYWMRDQLIHKFVGDVSPSTGHAMIARFPSGPLAPPHITSVEPATLPTEGGVVVLEGRLYRDAFRAHRA